MQLVGGRQKNIVKNVLDYIKCDVQDSDTLLKMQH